MKEMTSPELLETRLCHLGDRLESESKLFEPLDFGISCLRSANSVSTCKLVH